ncbi:helix-turn-helix transcriptional regulator [Pseudomaricurvus alkylphenolicus]|uniref:helix-turn-helix transcriptional regulator n=1 Tax=Pseudomaricurvus alkylphenolicus TaxID=1306991 RepID=UPI00142364DF|nr:AraC family transcriptional regulator [Pseudomaricurvus alkylphenolicus]NIB45028.1 helix-turn-helix transcriptional regulator [Pseudomaricurvus alkylphenolicus]
MSMLNEKDIAVTAKACEKYYNFSRDGALTDICYSNDPPLGPPLLDQGHDNINYPLLLELLHYWQKEGRTSRFIRFRQEGVRDRYYHLLGPSLLMGVFDGEVNAGRKPVPLWLNGLALLRINLHGDVGYNIGPDLLDLKEAVGLFSFGEEVPLTKNFYSEEPETGISILVNPKWLSEKLDVHQSQLTDLMCEEGETAGSITRLMRLDGRLMDLVNQLLHINTANPLYFLEVEALTLQLLFQSFNLLIAQSREGYQAHKLKKLDVEKLFQVRELLETYYTNPHSLDELSREIGLNRRKLTEGFKGLFGTTVHEYLLRQRMAKAAEMLRQGVSAKKAAYQVGYMEQSSFTRAFKRHYGVLPREFSV